MRTRTLLAWLEDVVFPPQCGGCGARGVWLCSACRAALRPVPEPLCPRCGRSLPGSLGPCVHPADWPAGLTVRGLFVFEGPILESIHCYKYRDEHARAGSLAALLLEGAVLDRDAFDLVAHVPLHPSRRRARGYDQAQLLARQVGRALSLPVAEGLHRVMYARPQVGLDYEARQENVRGAFAWRGAPLAGARVLLIDDVLTTGATLRAAAEPLLEAGASSVAGLALARDL